MVLTPAIASKGESTATTYRAVGIVGCGPPQILPPLSPSAEALTGTIRTQTRFELSVPAGHTRHRRSRAQFSSRCGPCLVTSHSLFIDLFGC